MNKSRFTVNAWLTPGIEKGFLQHLRDFDIAHPGCHFSIFAMVDAPTDTVADMLRVNPGFEHFQVIPRDGNEH